MHPVPREARTLHLKSVPYTGEVPPWSSQSSRRCFACRSPPVRKSYWSSTKGRFRRSIERRSPRRRLFAIGDPIRGTLRIATGRAPTDDLLGDPQIGQYFGGGGYDFIRGPRHPAGGQAGDAVIVYNDWEPPSTGVPREDGMIINDGWLAPNDQFNLLLGLQRPLTLGQLFDDDGLEQSFDVRSEPGMTLWGYIERGLGEFRRVVNFTLSRLSVTPRVCRA